MNNISSNFPVTNDEYLELNNRFGKLCEYAAWQLIKANSRNNHTDSQEDVAQELKISLLRAGSYYKRQVYIETCLQLCWKYAKDKFIRRMVEELFELWANKTRHGANRQKFGPHQEKLLYRLTKRLVPKREWPSSTAPLRFDPITYPFKTYWIGKQQAICFQIERNLKAYRAEHGCIPKTQDKFMDEIIKKGNIKLPQLPPGHKYIYEQGELMVEKPSFTTYCKNITWNQQKSLGKKITRERCIRSGLTSLSSYDYLAKTY